MRRAPRCIKSPRGPPWIRFYVVAADRASPPTMIPAHCGLVDMDDSSQRDLRHANQRQKMADVLITGASGFIGSAVARTLVVSGYSVRALVRPSSPRQHILGLDLELCEGDLRDQPSI